MKLLSFEQVLDTILESGLNTQPYLPSSTPGQLGSGTFGNAPSAVGQTPADQSAQTATFNPAQPMNQQMVQAAKVREQLQAQHLASLPLDQKIALALQKATEAEKVAYRTSRAVGDMDVKLDRLFKGLSDQLAQGGQAPAPKAGSGHGSSIWDEDNEDPESIWSGMR